MTSISLAATPSCTIPEAQAKALVTFDADAYLGALLEIRELYMACFYVATCSVAGIYYGTIVLYGHPEELVTLPKPIVITSAFSAIINPQVSEFTGKWGWLLAVVFSTGAGIDIIIASVLVWGMWRERNRGGEWRVDKTVWLLDRLIWWTIRLLTSIVHISIVIVFATMKGKLIWLAIYICLSKVYSHTLMAGLNSRRDLRREFDRPDVIEMHHTRARSVLPSRSNASGGDLNSRVSASPSDRHNGATCSIDRVVVSVRKDTLITRDGDDFEAEGGLPADSKAGVISVTD
ncbi:hypothetical protein MPER_10939 [Moniliophthora perniciosa FA553]|nr:hypothetical protein MPER_10939 [Moniliophthora perniciosa FA553]